MVFLATLVVHPLTHLVKDCMSRCGLNLETDYNDDCRGASHTGGQFTGMSASPSFLHSPSYVQTSKLAAVMADWNLRSVFADKFSRRPTGFSRVRCDDIDLDSPASTQMGRPLTSHHVLKTSLFALIYAAFTSVIVCFAMWRFPPTCRSDAWSTDESLLKTPVPRCTKAQKETRYIG